MIDFEVKRMAVVNSSRFNFKENIEMAVNRFLKDYQGEVIEAVTEVIPQVAKESAKKLKDTSPKGKTGRYAKGWTYKIEKGRLRIGATVYGKSGTYQIAHLLEHGHAKRNGGRVEPIEHIKPVEQWAVDEVFERVYDKLETIV